MTIYILAAFFNGVVISVARMINGRLSTALGALHASLWNHIVGFVFLSLFIYTERHLTWSLSDIPVLAYSGGLCGALFVALNSYLFSRMSALNAALFVISGQMIFAVLIDCSEQATLPSIKECCGVMIIIFGISIPRLSAYYKNLMLDTAKN